MNKLLILSFLIINNLAYGKNFKIGFNESNRMPFYQISDQKVIGGFIFDIFSQLSQRESLTFSFVPLPRKRASDQLKENKVDALCITNPYWYGDEKKEKYYWSEPLFLSRDVFISNINSPKISTIEDITGFNLATILGYKYSKKLTQYFKGKIKRQNFNKTESLIQGVSSNRAPYGVIGEEIIHHFSEGKSHYKNIRIENIVDDQRTIHCHFNKKAQLLFEKFNSFIKNQSLLAPIKAKYYLE